jgi:hypothetical protein
MAACYVMLLNIYVAVSNMCLCENVERQRKEEGVKKQVGHTWIEVNSDIHMFIELTGSRPPPCINEQKLHQCVVCLFLSFPCTFLFRREQIEIWHLGFYQCCTSKQVP